MDSLETVAIGPSCPCRRDLIAFNSGELSSRALEAVAEHVGRCPQCLSALGTLAMHESGTLRDLRHSLREPAPDPFADDPEYHRMERAAITLYSAGPTPPPWPDAAAAPDLTPPFTLGQYQVVGKIGQGGMGAVYRAIHPRLKKEFAIKVLRGETTADARAVARFGREMEAIGRLDHHNIVRATDAGEARGLHFLVMELVPGIDLSRLVRLCGPLPVADACELVRQAAAGLQCAHEHGLVHRDVKPSNLVLSTKGEVKVLDLGLALLSRGGTAAGELTTAGQVMGTPDYTAPEQWEASHDVDIRADIYSLGCTLYHLLTGRPPFAGPKYASTMRKMAAHSGESAAPLTDHRTDVPAPVERVLEKLLAKAPADRPATPAEVAQALEPFAVGADPAALAARGMALLPPPEALASAGQVTVRGEGTPASPAPVAVARRSRWRPRGVAAAAALLLLLTGAVALSGWHLWGPRADQAPPDRPATELEGSLDLLGRPPGTRLPPRGLTGLVGYDAKKHHLRFDTSNRALIPLGTTEARSYRLEIGFRQPNWTGGFGVYFGGREGPAPEVFRFQLIDLRPVGATNGPPFQLTRASGTIIRAAPDAPPGASSHTFARTILPKPPGNWEYLLRLEVKPGGLTRVLWDGAECQELVTGAAADFGRGAGDQGEFGIYCIGSSGTVMTARYWTIE